MEHSMMLNIKINYNNKTFPTVANPNTPLNTFLLTVLQSFNLNQSQYILKYQNTPILPTDSRPISALMKRSTSYIVFNLIQSSRQLSSSPNIKQTPTVVRIENVANYQSIVHLINNFLSIKQINQSNISKDPVSSIIRLTIPSNQIAYEFIQYLSQMKLSNNQLKNIKASLQQAPQSTQSYQSIIFKDQKGFKAYPPSTENNLVLQNSKSNLASNRSVTLPSIKNERYNTITFDEDKSNKKMIKNYYAKQDFIRNSSPYIDEEEKRFQEYHLNKKKWLVNDGFITSVGNKHKRNNNFIPNYVYLTPSESPLNHRFRDIKKDNWIDKKGFYVC